VRDDIDLEIRFDYPDITSTTSTENYAAGWKDDRWMQYYFVPTPDVWGGDQPIFLAAQEAILNSFGLPPEAVDLSTLATYPPMALESLGSRFRAPGPFYAVTRVTSFATWLDNRGPGWTGHRYRAERLASGEWVVGRLDVEQRSWAIERVGVSDLEMWQTFNGGPKELDGGRLRSFRWKSLFLAHSSADKDFVRRLATRLRALSIRVWVDEADIRVGDSVIDRLQSGIDGVDYVGVVLTPESVSSHWVQEELKMAMTRQIQHGKITVLPILFRDTKLPGFLRDKRYADFRGEGMFQDGVSDLLVRLQERFPEPGRDPQ
jgi:hypothetical protein